jgi:flagellar motor switch protein FliN/FliY
MSEILHALMDAWAPAMAEVLKSMAEQNAEIAWKPAPAPEAEAEQLWWKQPLEIAPDMTIWVMAPRPTWDQIGTVTLKAAGLETVETAEAKNTYIEILGQSLSPLARAIGGMLGREVTCGTGEESAPAAMPETGASATLDFGEANSFSLWIGFSPKLIAVLALPPESRKPEHREPAKSTGTDDSERPHSAIPPTMDLLLEVELPVSISFGKTQLPMKDVLKLTTGSIVELNRGVSEPVEVLVNHCLIARGEVVVVEGNYGVRIQHIASRADRLRSLR